MLYIKLLILIFISRDVVGKFELVFNYKFPDSLIRTNNHTAKGVTNKKLTVQNRFNINGKFRNYVPMFILARDNAETSTVFSPFSVIPPIALLSFANITSEYTYMINEYIGFNKHIIKTEMPRLWNLYRETKQMLVFMTMKIYVPENARLNKKFIHFAEEAFKVKPEISEFNSEKFENKLNLWLKVQTGIQARTIFTIKGTDDYTQMIVVFAVNIKGKWKHAFDSMSYDNFTSTKGPIKIKMMHKAELVKYRDSYHLDSKIISMPYIGNDVELVIVLPNDKNGLLKVMRKINATKSGVLATELRTMELVLLNISIPEFKVETEINLAPVIKNDLSFFYHTSGIPHMVEGEAYIDSALQKAFFKVTRKGTTSVSDPRPISVDGVIASDAEDNFVATHPFLFFVTVQGELFISGIFSGDERKTTIFDENYNDWNEDFKGNREYD